MHASRKSLALYSILFVVVATSASAQLFTIEIPPASAAFATSNLLVRHDDAWHWRRGTTAPQAEWHTAPDANLDTTWNVAPGGFGYGDDDIDGESTLVDPGMEDVHSTLYTRRTFSAPAVLDPDAALVLTVDYDDGFVAYLDGQEVARRNVPGGTGSPVPYTATTGGVSHEASCCNNPNPPVAVDLGSVAGLLSPGEHVLAIIGVNQEIDSSDFHLIADLATVTAIAPSNAPALVNRGLYALTTNATVTLSGSNTIADSVLVTIDGDPAEFDALTGVWSLERILTPGLNRLYLGAHDATGALLTNFTQDILHEVSASPVSGVLNGTNIWNDPAVVIHVTDDVTVPANAALHVGPGVVVVLAPDSSIIATTNGTIAIAGADERRAVLLPESGDWDALRALGTGALLEIRYGEVVSGQVRVGDGARLVLEDSIIRDLPDLGREVIESDNAAELTMRRTYMTRFAEGDSQNTPVLVEGCLLEGFLVDGMDIKATNSPLIVRRSTFRRADPNNSNADAIDFGPGAGTVESCLIHGFPDKGVSIGGAPGTVIRDSLIYDCGIGISAYSSTNLEIANTTVADCLTGILFRNNPTRAVGVATNLIVWGNVTNVSVLNSSQLEIAFSNLEGTNYPGTGNISADPLFVNASAAEYELSTNSPAQGTGFNGTDMGAPFPVGGIPSQPGALFARRLSGTQVELQWQDTAENEDGVLVQHSSNGTDWEVIGAAPRNATSFTDLAASAGAPYYRIRATNDVGVSEFSNRARALSASLPSIRIERQDQAVVLSFEAMAGQSYILQSRSNLTSAAWIDQSPFPAQPMNATLRVTNAFTGAEMYFRLVTP